jgi:inhibitor of KinA
MIVWRVLPLGEAALLVQGTLIHPAGPALLVNRYTLALAQALDAARLPDVQPAVPAIDSLLLPFDPLRVSRQRLEQQVYELLAGLQPVPEEPARVVRIAVRYGGDDGPDLLDVARHLQLTPQALVAAHCAPVYRVLLIGFAPGFPYLGPLPARLTLPRRATPRPFVPTGSVAIAADVTGIYPARLPGGWHLLGRTSMRLFDAAAEPPARLQPGDGVRFVPLPDGIVP